MQFDPNDLKNTIDKATKSFHRSVRGKDKKAAEEGTEQHLFQDKDDLQKERSTAAQERIDESALQSPSKESENVDNTGRQRKSSAGGRRPGRGRRSKGKKQETVSATPKTAGQKESANEPAEEAESNVSGAETSEKPALGNTAAKKRRNRRTQKTKANDVDSAVKKEGVRQNTAKKRRVRNSGKARRFSEGTDPGETRHINDPESTSEIEIMRAAGNQMSTASPESEAEESGKVLKNTGKSELPAERPAAKESPADEKTGNKRGSSAERPAAKESAENQKTLKIPGLYGKTAAIKTSGEKPGPAALQGTTLKATGAASWKRVAGRKSSAKKTAPSTEEISAPEEKPESASAEEALSQATGAASWKRVAGRKSSAKRTAPGKDGGGVQGERGTQKSPGEADGSGSQPTESSVRVTSETLQTKDFSEEAVPSGENAKAAREGVSENPQKIGEKLAGLSAGAGQFFRNLWTRCAKWWSGFFASLVKKVGYTIAAAVVVGVVAALFCCILFLSMAGSRSGKTAGNGTEGMMPEEGSEADYDGMAPADESGTSEWSQAIPGQTEKASGDTALSNAFQGLFTQTREAATMLREQAENSIREDYYEILESGKAGEFTPESGAQEKLWEEVRAERKEKLKEEPLLILVNKWHYLPEDYQVEPIDLPNGQQISSICYDKLNEMLEDCAEAGGTPIVCSGFRAHEKQEVLYDQQIQRWLYLGYGQEEAEALAATAVAIPGTSEHELGLAADIYSSENMDLDESQVNTFTQQWLMENCWKYGFILRYPKDKSEITGIIFEPWHYRYVGDQYAETIHKSGLSLEEYLDEAEHPYSPMDPFAGPEEETEEEIEDDSETETGYSY